MKGPGGQADLLLRHEAKCLQLSQDTYSSPNTIPEAHWRTLVADAQHKTGSPLLNEVAQDYLRLKQQWVSHRDQTSPDYVDTLTPLQRRQTLEYSTAMEGKRTRTFFSTVGGRVGLGPCDLEPGDGTYLFSLNNLRFHYQTDCVKLSASCMVAHPCLSYDTRRA